METDEATSADPIPITPVVVEANSRYLHILDVKMQTKHFPTPKIVDLVWAKPSSHGNEWNKYTAKDFISDSEDLDRISIKAKNSHVPTKLKRIIVDLFHSKRLTKIEISQKLFVSYFTVCRIIRQTQEWGDLNLEEIRSRSSRTRLDPESMTQAANYIAMQRSAFSSSDVRSYLSFKLNVDYSQKGIIEFMKKTLGLSYKKWSSRPVMKDSDRVNAFKTLFWIEFANIVDNSWIIVNIDEVCFSRLTRLNYSWGMRSENSSVNSISFVGTRSLIWAITSRGEWFASHLDDTNNAGTFVEFVGRLVKWIRIDFHYPMDKIILLLDNWPIHKSNKWINYFNKLGCYTVFLPPYTPEYVPMELLFNTLKIRLVKQVRNTIIKLNAEEGLRNIKEVLATFTKEETVSYWIKSFKRINLKLQIRSSKEGFS